MWLVLYASAVAWSPAQAPTPAWEYKAEYGQESCQLCLERLQQYGKDHWECTAIAVTGFRPGVSGGNSWPYWAPSYYMFRRATQPDSRKRWDYKFLDTDLKADSIFDRPDKEPLDKAMAKVAKELADGWEVVAMVVDADKPPKQVRYIMKKRAG